MILLHPKRTIVPLISDTIDEPQLRQKLIDLATPLVTSMNMPMPEFAIDSRTEVLAYTYGFPANSCVLVSRGVFDHFTDDMIKAMLAHELGHVQQRHLVPTYCLVVAAIVSILLGTPRLGLAMWLIMFWQMRRYEFQSDKIAATHVGKQPVIDLLTWLKHDRKEKFWSFLLLPLSTHPTFAARIAKIGS